MNAARRAVAFLALAAPAAAQVFVAPAVPRLAPIPVPVASPLAAAPLAAPAPSLLPLAAPLLAASAAPAASATAAAPSAPVAAAAPAGSARAAGAENLARSLNVFWDGVSLPEEELTPVFAPEAARDTEDVSEEDESRPAPWLETSNKRLSAALDAAVELARTTSVGRRALDEAQRALSARGRTLPVKALALGRNFGEYDYLEGGLRLNKKLLEPGSEAALAGTLVHELTHVAQHSLGVPSNALEMEIEAHLNDLEMLAELGVAAPPDTFASQSLDALAQGPDAFVALLKAAVPDHVYLGDSDLDEIKDQLEDDLDQVSARRGARSQRLAAVIADDLQRLKSVKGRAAYESFSARVMALLRERAAAAAKP